MSESIRVRLSVQQGAEQGLQEIAAAASSNLAAMRCPMCTSGRSPAYASLQATVSGARSQAQA